jgi:hypothetical protein
VSAGCDKGLRLSHDVLLSHGVVAGNGGTLGEVELILQRQNTLPAIKLVDCNSGA